MKRPDPAHSVAPEMPAVKYRNGSGSGKKQAEDAGMLLRMILQDADLRRSALGIAVLASLIAYGACGQNFIPAPINHVSDELDSTYDTVYKTLGRLAALGYVQLSRVANVGQRRLFLRVWWPQTKPVARRGGGKA